MTNSGLLLKRAAPFAIALGIWFISGLWVLYRVVKGYLLFKDSRAILGV